MGITEWTICGGGWSDNEIRAENRRSFGERRPGEFGESLPIGSRRSIAPRYGGRASRRFGAGEDRFNAFLEGFEKARDRRKGGLPRAGTSPSNAAVIFGLWDYGKVSAQSSSARMRPGARLLPEQESDQQELRMQTLISLGPHQPPSRPPQLTSS